MTIKRMCVALAAASSMLPVLVAAQPGPPPGIASQFPKLPERATLTEGNDIPNIRVTASTYIPDLPGSGPFPADYKVAPGTEFTVYAPTDVAAAAKIRKLPIYAWSNGGCRPEGAIQRFHLTDIASHGYIAVTPGLINMGPKGLGGGKMPEHGKDTKPQSGASVKAAIDFLIAENDRVGSPYYQAIDTTRIAVAGGSCGGFVAMELALTDPRVKSVTMHNSGLFKKMPGMPFKSEDDLAGLKIPTLFLIGGEEDVAYAAASSNFKAIKSAPVAFVNRPHVGHMGTAFEPFSEGSKIEYHWLEWRLFGNVKAGKMFAGADCSLCRDLDWKIEAKGF